MNDLNSLTENDPRQLKLVLQARAAELFKLCDLEEKGFINKKDIQRMREPLNLSPDQLEEVFDSLDIDKNGYLTLDEFTAGFSNYIGIEFDEQEQIHNRMNQQEVAEADEEFKATMSSLGAVHLIDSEPNIKDLWLRLRNEDQSLLRAFENFVGNMSLELNKTKSEFNVLESALQNKTYDYDENVKKLYEEMDAQIRLEKFRIAQKEREKEREMKEKLESELTEKEKHLQDSLGKQIEMEQKLFKLNLLEYQQKQENERLQREKAMLEEQLQEKNRSLQDSKSYIDSLVQQTKEEKKNRAKQALKITENIALERETLVRELEMLKSINKKLQDERDELELKATDTSVETTRTKQDKHGNKRLNKQGSILSNYMGHHQHSIEVDEDPFDPVHVVKAEYYSEDEEYEELAEQVNKSRMSFPNEDEDCSPNSNIIDDCIYYNCQQTNLKINFMTNDDLKKLRTEFVLKRPKCPSKNIIPESSLEQNSDLTGKRDAPSFHSEQTLANAHITNQAHNPTDIFNVPANVAPQRVFKIVFIGDSGVGKTSFVQRFCNNSFRESFSTTIGVDFQVKSIILDNRVIALQLWDTAGQERYRSITKQYFRKADGVICMYDISSEQSFKNLRNWITSMKESASEECVLIVIGNKIDLCPEDEKRVVRTKDGAGLAAEHNALFYETSSRQGINIVEAMESIARILQEKEDKQIEDVLNLRMKEKKKGCCS